jgi:secretion/DNA translocation related TadE-like protein
VRSRARGDDGVVAVVVVALSLLLVVVLGAGSVVADVLAARQRAAAAADLGALAAAPAAAWSERSACAAAESVVRANGAVLRECRIRSGDVWVTASAMPRSHPARWFADQLLGGTGPRVSARAGLR